jgi:hypothetical protein
LKVSHKMLWVGHISEVHYVSLIKLDSSEGNMLTSSTSAQSNTYFTVDLDNETICELVDKQWKENAWFVVKVDGENVSKRSKMVASKLYIAQVRDYCEYSIFNVPVCILFGCLFSFRSRKSFQRMRVTFVLWSVK